MVMLKGLPEDTVAALLASVLGTAPTTRLVRGLWRETGGNPLFMGEAVKLLAAEGSVDSSAARGTLRLTVPPGLREVIARRLRKLPSGLVDVLTVGSALGPEFSTEMLRRAGGYAAADVALLLDQASRAGLLLAVSGSVGRVRFSHGLVREVLYQEIPSAARAGLHLRMLRSKSFTRAACGCGSLASLLRGGHTGRRRDGGSRRHRRAKTYARQAGELAARSLAYEEASRHFRMALHPAAEDGVARTGLLLQLGDADARAGTSTGPGDSPGSELARRNGDAGNPRGGAGYGGRFVARAGRDRRLMPLLQDALVLPGRDLLRVRLWPARVCGRDSPPHRERSAAQEEAVELAAGWDPSTLGYA
jgi:hypothetical protein